MRDLFRALTGFAPLKWQTRLYDEYLGRCELPSAIDVPTGLGKTAVMALWLIARGLGVALPRRLVYVVDRRAVVDQASEFADRLRERLSSTKELANLRRGLELAAEDDSGGARLLPISTLRGQHIDNREWLEDPAASVIVVGTVDMVGSRLLFEGYGVSRKMRPYHAGMLGSDALVVLDEAHLVPPFERLLESIERDREQGGALSPRAEEAAVVIPRFRLLSLSATGRTRHGVTFRLEDEDGDDITADRLNAKKVLTLEPPEPNVPQMALENRLADLAWQVTLQGAAKTRCLVFCDRRETAQKTAILLSKRAKGSAAPVELFVGARRGREREEAARSLEKLGFVAGSKETAPEAAVFLVATSAAEVGVDLDADHMVCDVVAWERMVQRLGRVNRRGRESAAEVRVVTERKPDTLQRAVITLLQEHLPRQDAGVDASPGALRELKARAERDTALAARIREATSPAPARPSVTRPLLDSWSMTSLVEHTGRPEVAPWLRGWVDDLPQTRVAWRKYLPVRPDRSESEAEVLHFFEAAPPHATEVLETETFRVVEWLLKRARAVVVAHARRRLKQDDQKDLLPTHAAACVLSGAGDHAKFLTCNGLAGPDVLAARTKRQLDRELVGATLVVDARLAGLSLEGTLESGTGEAPRTLDDGEDWPAPLAENKAPVVPFRVRDIQRTDAAPEPLGTRPSTDTGNWKALLRFEVERSRAAEEVERWLQVDKFRDTSAMEDGRSVTRRPQRLDEHQSWAAEEARALATRLGLPDEYIRALTIAARLHDEGKRSNRWQRAFHAPRDFADRPYAKTLGPVSFPLLDGYRHELGSLPYAQNDRELATLPPELQDLVLHLIAAHHGYARPLIATTGCDDAPPTALRARAREVALRFLRMQQRWGPWGLAYLEALLRAADQRASRRNDEGDSEAHR